eukprot:CAMPEP_0202059084 /NCGR_PEP_ID=MMETSP0963-20130614/34049_1 /ASSEMBLY_ACC=CAM_ASM_000494 /TAXON_ID=4773 /ORGANISM="Schizochytrium aggregatum, Strain ATCC28209" /LENGTH=78 /DNA_ID=CAMNT_0048625103 /DNA_START=136 /DNA_END=369 /DNA_ORIENTATION=+
MTNTAPLAKNTGHVSKARAHARDVAEVRARKGGGEADAQQTLSLARQTLKSEKVDLLEGAKVAGELEQRACGRIALAG